MITVNCNACGESIQKPRLDKRRKHNFCNKTCYYAWQSQLKGLDNPKNKLQAIQCFHCQKEMLRAPWEIKRHKKMFCTPECYQEWLDKEKQAATLKCEICGTEKRFEGYKVRRNKAFFCSMKCRNIWRSQTIQGENHPLWIGLVTLECANCKKQFQRKREKYRKNNDKFFCTENCMFDYMTKQCGEDHPWYKQGGRYPLYGRNWRANRKKARERDNYTCQDCGTTETVLGKHLDVHHLISRAEGGTNDLDNLISLCRSCHAKREHTNARSYGTTLRKFRNRSLHQRLQRIDGMNPSSPRVQSTPGQDETAS